METGAEPKTGAEVEAYILVRVEEDPEFRARLIADPKRVIEAETGRVLPEDQLIFVEEAITMAQQGVASIDEPLTEDELVQVMGGACYNGVDEGLEWYTCGPGAE